MAKRSPRQQPDPTVTVRRVKRGPLYVRVSSLDPLGRPFVLIPGLGVSATYFERLAVHLSAYRPVHSLDLPGFGGVPPPRTGLTITAFADLVAAAIDDLALTDHGGDEESPRPRSDRPDARKLDRMKSLRTSAAPQPCR